MTYQEAKTILEKLKPLEGKVESNSLRGSIIDRFLIWPPTKDNLSFSSIINEEYLIDKSQELKVVGIIIPQAGSYIVDEDLSHLINS